MPVSSGRTATAAIPAYSKIVNGQRTNHHMVATRFDEQKDRKEYPASDASRRQDVPPKLNKPKQPGKSISNGEVQSLSIGFFLSKCENKKLTVSEY